MVFAYQENDADKSTHTATVVSVYVAEEARRQGIAGRLLDGMLEKLEGGGIKTVKLTVNQQQEAAVGLYLTRGFLIAGKEANRMGDGKVHTELLMERKI